MRKSVIALIPFLLVAAPLAANAGGKGGGGNVTNVTHQDVSSP